MLDVLRASHKLQRFKLSLEFHKDINWFVKYLKQFNGIVLFDIPEKPHHVYVDASLTGVGAVYGVRVYSAPIPTALREALTIVHFEMVNVIIALRVWGRSLKNSKLVIHSDNAAVVAVLNNSKTHDKYLASCLRLTLCHGGLNPNCLWKKNLKYCKNMCGTQSPSPWFT